MTIEKFVSDFTTQFIKSDGRVTIEFSTCPNDLKEVWQSMKIFNKVLSVHEFSDKREYRWHAFTCTTCESHDENDFIHVHIEQI